MRETLVETEEFKDSPLGEIPTGWQVGKLSNFYAVPARNGLYKSAQYYGRGVLMIHMPQMFRGLEIDISDAARVEIKPTELERFELKPGDLVFARRSLNLEGAGRCSLVPELSEPVTFESSIIRVRLSREQLRPAFANYFLNSEIGFRLRLPLIRQVAVSGVSSEDIASIPILVPPIPEQERIIEIIGTVDSAIAHTTTLIAKLKQMKAGLLHDLLTRGLDENGELRDATQHPEQFKDSPLGRIPKDWCVGKLDNLAINHDGKRIPLKQSDRDKMEEIYPYYGASGVIDWVDGYLFEGDYVLLGEDGENVVSRQLPLAFRASGRFWVNNHAHIYEPLPNVDIRFLNELLEFTDYSALVSGSAQPKLTQDALNRLYFRIPQPKEQILIANIVNTYNSRIRVEEAYRDKLKLQKKGLMHDLLTGKVRVKHA